MLVFVSTAKPQLTSQTDCPNGYTLPPIVFILNVIPHDVFLEYICCCYGTCVSKVVLNT